MYDTETGMDGLPKRMDGQPINDGHNSHRVAKHAVGCANELVIDNSILHVGMLRSLAYELRRVARAHRACTHVFEQMTKPMNKILQVGGPVSRGNRQTARARERAKFRKCVRRIASRN